MGYLEVTPDELIHSGQTLKAIAEDLRMAHHRMEGLRSAQLGSQTIDSASNGYFILPHPDQKTG